MPSLLLRCYHIFGKRNRVNLWGEKMNSRQIKFLKLLKEQSEYKPASFFAKWLSVSTKTIYSDINALYSFLQENGLDLDSSPRNGIKLLDAKNNLNKLIDEISGENKRDEYSPVNRRFSIIRKILLENKSTTLENLSNDFLVSKTSLYQDLGLINEVFERQNTKLKVTNIGIVSIGTEIDLQKSIKDYVFEDDKDDSLLDLKSKLELLFDRQHIDYVFHLLLEDYNELTNDVSIYYLKSIIVILLIQIVRLKYGYHVKTEETFLFNNIRYMETYVVANSIVEMLQQNLNLYFKNADIEYLCRQLFAHRITNSLKTGQNEYADLVNKIIEVMSKIEKIDLRQDKHLYKSLIYHVPAMILRLKKGIKIKNPLLENIKEQYTELFTIVWYALSLIESRYNVILNDEEVSLILVHFQIALVNISKANNILVVCPYGISSSQLILSKVRKLLPAKDNIELSRIEKLYLTDLSHVDLIITSVDLDNINVPYVRVSPVVTNEDYINIMDAYKKHILFKEEVLRELKNFSAPYLSQFINPTLIQIKKNYKNKKECLENLIQELENREYVNEKFRDSIFNRERAGVTCMDSGVALPHADPSTIITSSISILTLDKPVDWGGNLVSLIIMVCLNEDHVDKFKDVIQEIYQIIIKKEYIDQIVKISSIDAMIDLFYK